MIFEADKKYLSVGYKQTMRAVAEDSAKTVYIARDSEDEFFKALEEAVKNKSCEVFYVDTMRELGKQCGIDKSASCAVIIKH